MNLKGLNTDSNPSQLPNGSWIFGRNIYISDDGKTIRNEDGFDEIYEEENTGYIINGFIVTPKDIVIFSTNNTISKITRINSQNVDSTVLRTQYLDFHKNAPISGIYKYNYEGDLIICFWSGIGTNSSRPYILNIDNLPFPLDVNKEIDITAWNNSSASEEDLSELTRLFPQVNIPYISGFLIRNQSGVETGTYQFCVAYGFNSYDYTPYFPLSQPFSCYNVESDYEEGITQIGIKLTIGNIFPAFSKLRVAAIKRDGDSIEAFQVADINIETGVSTNFYFTGQRGIDIDYKELVIPKQTFERIQSGTAKEDRLYIGNTKNKYFNYQPWANEIEVDFVVTTSSTTTNTGFTGLFYDHVNRQLMPNEVYAFYIHPVYKDGFIGAGFHIPGRQYGQYFDETGETVSEVELLSDYNTTNYPSAILPALTNEHLGLSTDTRIFHTRDTSYYTDSPNNTEGKFGFWRNANEVYPDNESFDGSIYGSDISGQNVRHHKTPSLLRLAEYDNSASNEIKYCVYPKFKNIVIPSELDDQIDGFLISYAKRTFKNSTVLGMSPIISSTWPYTGTADTARDMRIYDYGILGLKPSLPITHVKAQGLYVETAPADLDEKDLTVLDSFNYRYFATVNKMEYGIEDNSISLNDYLPTGNANREEVLHLNTTDSPNYIKQTRDSNDLWTKVYIGTLQSNKLDVYSPFYQQELVFGKPYIPKSVIVSPTTELDIKGFDTYLQQVSINMFDSEFDSGRASVIKVSTALTANTKYRVVDAGTSRQVTYQTKNGWFRRITGNVKYDTATVAVEVDFANVGASMSEWVNGYEFICTNSTTPTKWGKARIIPVKPLVVKYNHYGVINYRSAKRFRFGDDLRKLPTFDKWLYNQAMHAVSDLGVPSAHNPYYEYNIDNKYTIHRSIIQPKEDKAIKWRSFLTNEYYIMDDKSKGAIINLNVFGDTLVINQEYGFFVAATKDAIKVGDKDGTLLEAYLGQVDLFDRPPQEVVPTSIGYAGCKSRFGFVINKYGYFFLDILQGKVFLFDGQKLLDIGDGVVEKYLNNIKTLGRYVVIDNPFIGFGFSLGYDYTKEIVYVLNKYSTASDYILSFSPKHKVWIGFHSWSSIPNSIFSNKLDTYSVLNKRGSTEKGLLYKHNSSFKHGEFYKNQAGNIEVQESFIDIVLSEPINENKLWLSFELLTKLITRSGTQDLEVYNETATHIMVYNGTQCSGLITINPDQTYGGSGNIAKSYDKWIFNDFKDLVVDPTSLFLDSNGEPNSNVDSDKDWTEQNNFISDHIIIRVMFDNTDSYNFHLNDIKARYKLLKN